MSRTKNSLVNLVIAMTGQGIGLIISFISRIFFIKILGKEYLGIDGLFGNILTMLSLVELGIGPAIIFSLYKPLAENDIGKIQSLMHLYKKAYTVIGIAIATLGLGITPFLHYFIKDMPNVSNLNFIFMLFVINSSTSYFFSYKRNLIIADQRRYIATIYRYAFFAILNIFQIIFLYLTKSYIIFLTLQIVITLLENIVVARCADRMYPFLKQNKYKKLDNKMVNEIKKNTGAMVLHKIGGTIVNSTDNILISAKVGIVWVAVYSNYQLVIGALNTIISQLFSSITASVGNLGATEDKEKSLIIFQNIQFINFWIYGFSSICLFYLLNPFINLWLGKDLLIDIRTVAILVINFYVQGMRKTVLTFRDALGLFWYDRYKPLFEVVINLLASIILAPSFGIKGIFIGTFISTMTTCFWVEPYILYRKGFNSPLKPYFLKYVFYTIATVLAGFVTGQCITFIRGTTFFVFAWKLVTCLLIPNILFLIFFLRTTEFEYLWSTIKSIIFIFKKSFKM